MKKHIGPKMMQAIEYVNAHPGLTQQQVALAIGPNGSHAFGTRILYRCYDAGLIKRTIKGPRFAYALTVTPLGLNAYQGMPLA